MPALGVDEFDLGPGEIDVWQIIAAGNLLEILNQTPGGDIVAIDVGSIFNLEVRGNLGSTFVGSFGPRLIGPFLGAGAGTQGREVNIAAPLHTGYNGMLFRPTNDSNNMPTNAYLDDLGSPVNPYLNGLLVRGDGTNAVNTISVFGSVENIAAPLTTIGTININSDNISLVGQFHGLNGSIYADEIVNLNVGDGIAAQVQNSLTPVGVWVNDDLHNVVATRQGASIRGVISASNTRPGDDTVTFVEGIGRIEISGGGAAKSGHATPRGENTSLPSSL